MAGPYPNPHTINTATSAVFEHCFETTDQDMRGLYEKAKRDQWNASQDIDWSQESDPDRGIVADGLIDIHETKYWDRLSLKQRTELNRHFSAWRISQLMYGEEFAMLICSQLVEMVPGIDAKFFLATQVVDEARHSEVLARYLHDKVEVVYPLAPYLRRLFDSLLEAPQWYLKTVGTQLVAETLAVSLFRMLADSSQDPIICEICQRILSDESRHMGFGMLSLPEQVEKLSEQERHEAEDFACEGMLSLLQGQFPREAYEAVGFNKNEIEDILHLRRETAQKNEQAMFRQRFKRDFHSALWNNLSRVGLMSERVMERLGTMGISAPQQQTAAA
jgi:rubrerythrin